MFGAQKRRRQGPLPAARAKVVTSRLIRDLSRVGRVHQRRRGRGFELCDADTILIGGTVLLAQGREMSRTCVRVQLLGP
jgi:hypothetical protein